MNPVAIRLLNQQLIVPQFKTPAEVVSHMGAMQAQEYRMMRWAVEMRTKKPSFNPSSPETASSAAIGLHSAKIVKWISLTVASTWRDYRMPGKYT